MDNLPGWLTTVTARLGLDRLRAKTPVPVEEVDVGGTAADPADEVILADRVGIALQVVLDRLNPGERVAFILHDSFCIDFSTVAEVLGSRRWPRASSPSPSRSSTASCGHPLRGCPGGPRPRRVARR